MGKLNMDAMKERLENESQGGNYSNADYDKLVKGKNVRRVLWPKGNNESFYSEGYVHFSLGDEGNKVVTCPKTFSSKNKCPICEYVEKLQKSKNKDDEKLAKDIKAKRRIYINVLNRDSEEEEETPKVLPIGVTILKGLLETICDADYGDITDPETGRDVTITRKGEGMKTEYSLLPKPKSSIVSETLEVDEIEEAMTDLESLFVEKTYEELEAVLNGEDSDDEDSDEEEDEEDSDDGYDEMSVDELEELCKKRKIKLPAKVTRLKLIGLLTKYDEEAEEDEGDEEEEETNGDSSDDGDGDEIQDAIAQALSKRKGKK